MSPNALLIVAKTAQTNKFSIFFIGWLVGSFVLIMMQEDDAGGRCRRRAMHEEELGSLFFIPLHYILLL